MNVLFVPSIGLDVTLLERLAASVDYDMKWKVVLNNGPLGALEVFARAHPDWIVKEEGNNLGVAGSWNYAAKLFPDEPAILLMNEDAYFLPGYLQRICAVSDHCVHDAPLVYLNDSRAFYCFVWHAVGREKIGTFDENLWPAYYEDCDYRIRVAMSGMTCQYALPEDTPLPHGKPRTGGTDYNAMIQGCGLFNRAYWLKKWGSLDFEKATYEHPYRDHRLSPKEWVWYPEERAKRFPLWQTFVEQPNPSIYE